MSDSMDPKNAPGFEPMMNGYSTATKSLQTFATEMQTMSKAQMEQTTQLMEKLRGAKTFEEVVQLQTTFMQQSFSQYADYSRRFGELMMAAPMEFAKQGHAAFQQGSDAMKKATEENVERIKDATQGHG